MKVGTVKTVTAEMLPNTVLTQADRLSSTTMLLSENRAGRYIHRDTAVIPAALPRPTAAIPAGLPCPTAVIPADLPHPHPTAAIPTGLLRLLHHTAPVPAGLLHRMEAV